MKGDLFTNERIQNIGVFFLETGQYTDLQKLLKLYYFSDRIAYIATGLTMSGLNYFAHERGPVPDDLAGAIGGWLPDTYGIKRVLHYNSEREEVILKQGASFARDFFSERELYILKRTKQTFSNMTTEQLSDKSHKKGLPWEKIWDGGQGEGILIDFSNDNAINPHKRKMIDYVQSSVKKFQRSAALL